MTNLRGPRLLLHFFSEVLFASLESGRWDRQDRGRKKVEQGIEHGGRTMGKGEKGRCGRKAVSAMLFWQVVGFMLRGAVMGDI